MANSLIATPNVYNHNAKYPVIIKLLHCMILPLFPYMTIFLLVLHYDSGKQTVRGGWSGIGTASSGIDPTGFGLYPTRSHSTKMPLTLLREARKWWNLEIETEGDLLDIVIERPKISTG